MQAKNAASGHDAVLRDVGWLPAMGTPAEGDPAIDIAASVSTPGGEGGPSGKNDMLLKEGAEESSEIDSVAGGAPSIQPVADSSMEGKSGTSSDTQQYNPQIQGRELRSVEDSGQNVAASRTADVLAAETVPQSEARAESAAIIGLSAETMPDSRQLSALHEVARAKTVAEVSNLRKYVVQNEGDRDGKLGEQAAASQTAQERQKLLEEHLMETSIREVCRTLV